MSTPSKPTPEAPAASGEGLPLGGALRAVLVAIALGEAVVLALGIYPTLGR